MMQQRTHRNRPQAQEKRQPPQQQSSQQLIRSKRLKRSDSSSSGSSSEERSHSADGDLHEAAQMPSSSRTMRRQQTARSVAQPIGVASSVSSAALLVAEAVDRRRRRPAVARRQQPYSPRKLLLDQMKKWQQLCPLRKAAASNQPPIIDQHREVGRVGPSSGGGSTLARELLQQRQRTTAWLRPRVQKIRENDAMQAIKSKSKSHQWHWNDPDGTQEQRLLSDDKLEVCFHPECAESTVAIRGSQPFRRNGNYYYWEVTIYDKIFGTSMMLGLCTEDQTLHKSDYCNLVGLDQHGWSLSHKGLIWHNGKYSKYTNDFTTNQTLTVGLLFDTMRGELSYFINGENLGVAFSGLNKCNKDLYPVIGSTAKRTRMRLTGSYCGYVSLFERTCYTVLKSIKNEAELVQTLQDNRIPPTLINHMAQLAEVCRNQTEKIAPNAQCVDL